MDYQFINSPCPFLKRVLGEVRSLEQAQEIRLTDGMPDIGRVLCGWGQILQRSKEWNGDSITLSAGMMVWVLYAPEDGSGPRTVEGWIPFSMTWDLPETLPEGKMQITCLTKFVDVRSVSARKIMVRAGIGAMAQAYIPYEAQIYGPQGEPPQAELKKARYPLHLATEAGEKFFSMDEDLDLPATVPEMEKLILYTMDPEILEKRVMTDKLLFRGNARIHILYEGAEGKLHSWDFSQPFNQFAELGESCAQEAEAQVFCAVTALELEQSDSNSIHIKAGMIGQYLVEDTKIVEIVEDAYSPVRALEVQKEELQIPRILESRRDMISPEASIPGDGVLAADALFLPDYPRHRYVEGSILSELSGTFQVLYYGADGALQCAVSRWEDQRRLDAGDGLSILAVPLTASEPQILMGTGDMKLRSEFPLQTTIETQAGLPMVTGLQPGEELSPQEDRPSLILRRAGEQDLWEIAKAAGSTIHAIQTANHLENEPVPGQMLLIPIL